MKEEGTSNPKTIPEKPPKEDYAKLIVEKGEVLIFDRVTKNYTEVERGKEYVLGKERNQKNPVKIGREDPSIRRWLGLEKMKDILLPGKYGHASREHCEIFYDEDKNAYFLADYSLHGTLVNCKRVGGNRVRETRRLEHADLIEIPAVGEKIKMTFLMYKQ